jgi:hypothetical protein
VVDGRKLHLNMHAVIHIPEKPNTDTTKAQLPSARAPTNTKREKNTIVPATAVR